MIFTIFEESVTHLQSLKNQLGSIKDDKYKKNIRLLKSIDWEANGQICHIIKNKRLIFIAERMFDCWLLLIAIAIYVLAALLL